VSIERNDRPDVLCIVWKSISTSGLPIAGYLVYLNGVQCGPMVRFSLKYHVTVLNVSLTLYMSINIYHKFTETHLLVKISYS